MGRQLEIPLKLFALKHFPRIAVFHPPSNPAERTLWLSSLFKVNTEKHLAHDPTIGGRKAGNRALVAWLYPLSSMTDGSQKDKNKTPRKTKTG